MDIMVPWFLYFFFFQTSSRLSFPYKRKKEIQEPVIHNFKMRCYDNRRLISSQLSLNRKQVHPREGPRKTVSCRELRCNRRKESKRQMKVLSRPKANHYLFYNEVILNERDNGGPSATFISYLLRSLTKR